MILYTTRLGSSSSNCSDFHVVLSLTSLVQIIRRGPELAYDTMRDGAAHERLRSSTEKHKRVLGYCGCLGCGDSINLSMHCHYMPTAVHARRACAVSMFLVSDLRSL
jgi:hypothetical protein